MSKTTNNPELARVEALEGELRIMRETHAAEMAALRQDLLQARTLAASDANPLDTHSDARFLAERLDPALNRKRILDATTEAVARMDREMHAHWSAAIAGEFLYVLMAETPGEDNSTGRTISNSRTARVIGSDGPEERYARWNARNRYLKFMGATAVANGAESLFCKQITGEREKEVRQLFSDAIARGTPENDLVSLAVGVCADEMDQEIAVRRASQQQQRPAQRDVANRFGAHEQAGYSLTESPVGI